MRSFIYSLPRSGSAWLSVFLTGRNSFFFHDPSAGKESIGALFDSRDEECVGAVDTAAYLDCPTIGRELRANCYALCRDPQEIVDSLYRAGLRSPHYNIHHEMVLFASATAGMPQILHSQLNDDKYLEWVFETVTEQPYDRRRSQAIADMNIQRDLKKFFAL